jgi:penicillin-binding protein 2A
MKKSKIIIFSFIFLLGIYFIFPYFIKVQIQKIPNSTIVYDENNNEIWEIIAQEKYRHIEKKIDEIPIFFKKSIISIEDRRFYFHSWIDYIGILRAFKNNIFGSNLEWASTIDNQVIRNSYWLNEKRWYKLKIKEFVLALALNKKYSKDKILEMYINNINFWYLNYWVASASRFYYKKDINNLTKAEMLWLITIIKNPNRYSPITNLSNFNKRFKVLTEYLEKNSIISNKEKNEIL